MAIGIQAVSRTVSPGPPGQPGHLGRSGRQRPGMISSRIIHDQVDLGPRDTLSAGRIGARRAQQRPDTGFWHEAQHNPVSYGEFRHPGHIQGWLAVQHSLPECRRSTLITDVKDDMHRADHANDDSAASRTLAPPLRPAGAGANG